MGINIGLDIQKLYALGLLEQLLKDKTTGHNILWATEAHSALGMRYGYDETLSSALITGGNAGVVQARAQKGQARRDKRTRQRGEVCTPLWVVKKMTDHADEVWFGAPGRFFDGDTPTPRVQFDRENGWQRYVDSRRLEIACGEAPYLATRYDGKTGEGIPLAQRFGILDRKLRVVGENTDNEADWLRWALRAFEACYGYELQGDSLLTARVNLLMTFADYYSARWRRQPAPRLYRKFVDRIVWNIWQMDGLTGTLPCVEQGDPRLSLADFAGGAEAAPPLSPPRCRIYDWRGKRSLPYGGTKEGRRKGMQFDHILGNPPYQEETESGSTRMPPIYHRFMEQAYGLGDSVELITPARFLFRTGSTPKAWNEKMLNDPHFHIQYYEPDSRKIFPDADIKGGIAISHRSRKKEYGPIVIFTKFQELNKILSKVGADHAGCMDRIIFSNLSYKASDRMKRENPSLVGRLRTNAFTSLADIFFATPPDDGDDHIAMIGLVDTKRTVRYIRRDYIQDLSGTLDKYTLLLPSVNGTGRFGETLPPSMIAGPGAGYTQTFIGIGAFDRENDARNADTYIKTKFARAMLGVLKTTQHCPGPRWACVPLQDFTPASDIDWSQPLPAIDRQLYAKYGLDEQEAAFIESHVKGMAPLPAPLILPFAHQ